MKTRSPITTMVRIKVTDKARIRKLKGENENAAWQTIGRALDALEQSRRAGKGKQ